ncbi:hypothetical protein FPZ42_16960 [Mucilaginibacter achroorhodeus]|uniref:Uncharacterized protein n=2 Tax=Sphingobacteriaceae TaxID=84566 RepID=A0A563TXT3_9SPHI|nr:hypothetical protein FPZ42_16960 [Mucilaginibacter achroorhodeus]
MHRFLEDFIEQNSLGYFEKLNLKPVVLPEDQVAREIEQFGFLKYKNNFENQTKEDKELENWLGYQQLKIYIK